MVIVEDGEPCQGACTGRGHVESYCSGHAADRLAASVLGPSATAHDLVEQRIRRSTRDRPAPRHGDRLAREPLRPGGGRDRRRLRRRRGRAAARAGARGRRCARRSRRPASECGSRSPSSAPTAGRDRRRRWSRSTRSRRAPMPLAVCATPIGNLDDVTLRVLDELRDGRRRALRGHAAHTRVLLDAARDLGAARSPSTSTTRPTRIAELLPRLEAGERVALVSDAGLPGHLRSRARGSCGRRSTPGVPVTVLPGPVGRRDGARRERARGGALRVRRLPAAAARRSSTALWAELARVARGRWSRSSRRGGCRRRCARSRRSRRSGRSRCAAS